MDDNLQPVNNDQINDSKNNSPVSSSDNQPVFSQNAPTLDKNSVPENVGLEPSSFKPVDAVMGDGGSDKSVEEGAANGVKTFTETVDDVEEDTESYMDDTATA